MSRQVEPIAELRQLCRRHNYKANLKTHPFSGRVSIYFTWAFLHTSITPNQVTFLYLIVGLLTALAYSCYGPVSFIVGYVLWHLYVILDVVDGEIARYRQMMSTRGAYLDYVTHYTVYPLLMFCIGYAFYRQFDQPVYLIGAFGTAYGRVLDLMSKDAWYRANFGKTTKQDIEGTVSRQVGRIQRWGMLLMSNLNRIESQLSALAIGVVLATWQSELVWMPITVFWFYVAFPLLCAVLRIVYTFRRGKIPRREAYYKW